VTREAPPAASPTGSQVVDDVEGVELDEDEERNEHEDERKDSGSGRTFARALCSSRSPANSEAMEPLPQVARESVSPGTAVPVMFSAGRRP